MVGLKSILVASDALRRMSGSFAIVRRSASVTRTVRPFPPFPPAPVASAF